MALHTSAHTRSVHVSCGKSFGTAGCSYYWLELNSLLSPAVMCNCHPRDSSRSEQGVKMTSSWGIFRAYVPKRFPTGGVYPRASVADVATRRVALLAATTLRQYTCDYVYAKCGGWQDVKPTSSVRPSVYLSACLLAIRSDKSRSLKIWRKISSPFFVSLVEVEIFCCEFRELEHRHS